MKPAPRRLPLSGCTVIVTRPAGTGAALSRAVRARGGAALSLPGAALRGPAAPEAARAALDRAAGADVVVFTSPAAVRFALALRPRWRPRRGTAVHAVGPATARALARRGIAARAPGDGRYDSEGLLAALAACPPRTAAVVGAPGGRGLIGETLRARGAAVAMVDAYRRQPARIDARHLRLLAAARGRLVLLLSSVESLDNLRAALPPEAWSRLRRAAVVASSRRVADAARAAGLRTPRIAASALGRDLLAAAAVR